MQRRDFLSATLSTACLGSLASGLRAAVEEPLCAGRTFASPQLAMAADPERLLFVTCIAAGEKTSRPDYLATVDLDQKSATYSQVVGRLAMPHAGDELHHFGWNTCASCHALPGHCRRYLVVPGLRSSRIHIVDGADPRGLKLHKVIEPEQIAARTNLSAPHTVHCLPSGQIMISMLGDAQGNAPGGFLLLDEQFEIAGRWDPADSPLKFNYDFWYQPRHNVMVSSEWAAPRTFGPGFKLEDVKAGKYGSRLNFWDWKERKLLESIDLGSGGLIPLEVRFHHDPASTHGFVGAALASTVWHWHRPADRWQVEKVIEVEPVELAGWPFPLPGLITDQLLSLDDRWLYFSNWLHGDLRQYDISNPSKPRLAAQLWCGGLLGKAQKVRGRTLAGGPQMLQLSLDGKRLFVTNSLYSSWDDQFYPQLGKSGSYLLQIECDTQRGGLRMNEDFYVDFGKEPGGAARAHEMRFPDGDCTSDIWV
ncbi:MAG TPA: selenium-binding family protein [Pirellulales bacterium]|jgi:selenium-binding protein 1|nr:selenium-binding family protein [Pirellulales bacterium]